MTKLTLYPNIEYNGKMHETNIGKAEALNSFFIKQSQLTKDAPELPTYTPPQYPPSKSLI